MFFQCLHGYSSFLLQSKDMQLVGLGYKCLFTSTADEITQYKTCLLEYLSQFISHHEYPNTMFFVCIQWEKLIRWRHSSKGQAQKPLYSFLSFLWAFYSGSYLQNEELSRFLNGKWTGSYIMLFYCALVLQTQTHKHLYTCTSTFFHIHLAGYIFKKPWERHRFSTFAPKEVLFCFIIICLLHSITLFMCFHINTSIKLTLYS